MTRLDVLVSIQGRQFFGEHADSEQVELVTSGELVHNENEYILTYNESDLGGSGGSVTMLMIDPARITLLRSGPVYTQMVFEEGRKHLSCYDTEEGTLTVGVQARRVSAAMSDCGGEIEMEYDVEIDNALTGASHVKINVREAGGKKKFNPNLPGVVFDRYAN